MKLSKEVKNQYPKAYGYGSVEELQNDPKNTLPCWVPIKDSDDDLRFIPCTKEYYHWHRNQERNERRRKDIESRCLIFSKKFGLVKCRADCSKCRRKRTGKPISMDYLFDHYAYEIADKSYEDNCKKIIKQEQSEILWKLVSEFNKTDQLILKLFNKGKSDRDIAEIVNKSRSMVQEKRTKLIKLLKEKLKNMENNRQNK